MNITDGRSTPAGAWHTVAAWGAHIAVLAMVSLGGISSLAAQSIGLPGQSSSSPLELHADEGIEWRQKENAYIAQGNARAKQGDVAVHADMLIAYYREQGGKGTKVWRIDGHGKVRIVSAAQTASGDKAVYDLEQGVLVLTGNIRLDTASELVTARDSLEYWDKRNLIVARGNATARRAERTLRAEVLTAYLERDKAGKNRVRRIDAINQVIIKTESETVRANKGVYQLNTGIATLEGNVRITRGKSQLNGAFAEVNLNTGVSRIIGGGQRRVEGVFEKSGPGKGRNK